MGGLFQLTRKRISNPSKKTMSVKTIIALLALVACFENASAMDKINKIKKQVDNKGVKRFGPDMKKESKKLKLGSQVALEEVNKPRNAPRKPKNEVSPGRAAKIDALQTTFEKFQKKNSNTCDFDHGDDANQTVCENFISNFTSDGTTKLDYFCIWVPEMGERRCRTFAPEGCTGILDSPYGPAKCAALNRLGYYCQDCQKSFF